MKILAVDTSSKNCSVSIVEVDENENFEIIAQDNNDDERTHSVKLMPMIDNMFKSSNLSLDMLEEHLSTSKSGVNKLKSKRIMERINQLSEDMVMVAQNYRGK